MITRANRFAEAGCSIGLQSGEEDSCLYLCRRDRRIKVDCIQWAADNGHRCMPACGSVTACQVNLCAHLRERFADTLHGTRRKRVVADQGKGMRMRCDQSSEHTHRAARIAAIERMFRFVKGSGNAGDFN